jgi:hypothetical protein
VGYVRKSVFTERQQPQKPSMISTCSRYTQVYSFEELLSIATLSQGNVRVGGRTIRMQLGAAASISEKVKYHLFFPLHKLTNF